MREILIALHYDVHLLNNEAKHKIYIKIFLDFQLKSKNHENNIIVEWSLVLNGKANKAVTVFI